MVSQAISLLKRGADGLIVDRRTFLDGSNSDRRLTESLFHPQYHSGIPDVIELQLSKRVTQRHPLHYAFDQPLEAPVICLSVLERLRHGFTIDVLSRSATAASDSPGSRYFNLTCPRTLSFDALALLRTGHCEEGVNLVAADLAFLQRHIAQLENPRKIVDEGHKVYRLPDALRPVDRNSGVVGEYDQPWHNTQFDELCWSVWQAFRAANNGFIELKELDERVKKITPSDRFLPGVVATLRFIDRVEAWNQPSHGSRAFFPAEGRASELGVMIAALSEVQKWARNNGWHSLFKEGPQQVEKGRILKRVVAHSMSKLKEKFAVRVPDRAGAFATECDTKYGPMAFDSNLAILLFPLDLDLTLNQQRAILRTVEKSRMDVGFRRWEGDSEGCHYAIPEKSNLEPVSAVQDACLTGFYARRFGTSENTHDARCALSYMRRLLACTTAFDYESVQNVGGRHIVDVIPSGSFADALIHHQGTLVPTPNARMHVPMALATLAMLRASQVFARLHLKENAGLNAFANN